MENEAFINKFFPPFSDQRRKLREEWNLQDELSWDIFLLHSAIAQSRITNNVINLDNVGTQIDDLTIEGDFNM